jgi:aspartate carbamoyltransferase catalytic subunit
LRSSQALLDLLTICAAIDPINPRLALLKDKKIAIVGDILHSRVARSNIWSLTASGAQVHLAAPPTLLPAEFADYCREPRNGIDNANLCVHWQIEPALQDADFVMTLRLQQERMTDHLLPSLREYHQHYGITRERLRLCQPHVKILHPGPTNRGVEITSDLMDDLSLSLISEQVNNGVAIRMALLYLMGNTKDNN